MLKTLRRIVTGHNAAGRSEIAHDDVLGSVMELDGNGLGEIWSWDTVPDEIKSNFIDPTAGPLKLEPASNGVKVRYFLVPPEPREMSDDARAKQEQLAAMGFEMVGAAHCRVDTQRHPAMHKTGTTDVIVLLKGEVTLLLDDGETVLKQGDCVVQQATNHAWVNHGQEPALLLAVLVDGTN